MGLTLLLKSHGSAMLTTDTRYVQRRPGASNINKTSYVL